MLYRAMYTGLLKTVARLQAAGVTILAGADVAGDRIPGFGLHDELDALAMAAPPLQALQAATLNPATVMKLTSDYGAVEPGKIVAAHCSRPIRPRTWRRFTGSAASSCMAGAGQGRP